MFYEHNPQEEWNNEMWLRIAVMGMYMMLPPGAWSQPVDRDYLRSPMYDEHPAAGQPDPYKGLRNDKTGVGCCGGHDCAVLKDVNRVRETKDEYIVDEKWHFKKDEAMPSWDGQYHACIWGGKPRCFFYPSNV